MTFLAGQILTAGQLNTRVGTTGPVTSDSSDFTTTETELLSVEADLISGRLYKVVAIFHVATGQAGDQNLTRLREDNTTGTALQQWGVNDMVVGTPGSPVKLEGYYAPASNETKTFVATGQRVGAGSTGTHRMEANAGRPAFLYVDYVPDVP